MAKIFTQTDGTVTFEQGCSPTGPGDSTAGGEIVEGGAAGSNEVNLDPGNESTASVLALRTTGGVGEPLWDGGDYVVRLNVTGAGGNSDWIATYLCERTAAGSFNPVAELTGQAVDVATSGVKSMTLTIPEGWELEGNSLDFFDNPGNPLVTYLTETTVAYIDSDNEELRTYEFDGTDWTQVGNGLAVPITTGGGLVAITSSRVVLLERNNRHLQAYDFDGTDWTVTGNPAAELPGSFGTLGLAALTSTRVAASESDTDTLTTFEFDGTDWSQVGNSFTQPSATSDLGTLSDSRVVAVSYTDEDIRAYEFDGTDWSQVGNAGAITTGTSPFCEGLGANRAIVISNSSPIREYLFDGTDWTEDHSSDLPYNPSVGDISAWDRSQVAIVDRDRARLDQYQYLTGYVPEGADSDLHFVLVFQNFDSHGGSDTDVTLDQDIDTPITEGVAASGGATATVNVSATAGGTASQSVEDGSIATVSVAPAAGGEKGSDDGSVQAVSVASVADGEKGSEGGAEETITVAPQAGGEKNASDGAISTVEVIATAGGSAADVSGGSEATVSVSATGAGIKDTEGGATPGVSVSATSEGEKASEGGAESSVSVTASGAGESTLPPPGASVYGPWEQNVTVGAVSGARVRDMSIQWQSQARVDKASFTVENMPSMAASFDACELGARVSVVQTGGDVSVRFDGTIVSVSDERGSNWTQRHVDCHSDEVQAKWVRFQRQWENARADTIVQEAWEAYGTPITASLDIGSNPTRLDISSSFDTLFDLMEQVCRRTAWAWRMDQGTMRFFDPLSEQSPPYDQSSTDVEGDTLNVDRDTKQIVNAARTPVWIYRTKRATVKALAAGDCVKSANLPSLIPPFGWELVGSPRIVEDFAPDGFDREVKFDDGGWIVFDPPLIPEEQAEAGELFLQLHVEVVVEVTHRRKVWLLMESADSIAEYGRREGPPLNDDGGQDQGEGEQRLREHLARHAFPTVEVSGAALKFGYQRDTISNVSLLEPPLAAPLYVTSVQHTTRGNELQVQLEFASPDTVLDSGQGQRPTTSDIDVVHELTRRIMQIERRDAHPLGVLGLTTAEVGPLSPADGAADGSGWGGQFSVGSGTSESVAEGSGWGETVTATEQ